MAFQIRIPKLSDEGILQALVRIRNNFKSEKLKIFVTPLYGNQIEFSQDKLKDNARLSYLGKGAFQSVHHFELRAEAGSPALYIDRIPDQVTDRVNFPDDWPNYRVQRQSQEENFAEQFANFESSVRRELKANDAEASLIGGENDPWGRYRDAQASVVNSLQKAAEDLIIRAGEKNLEIEAARSAHYEKLETQLREQLLKEREDFNSEIERKNTELAEKEKNLADREAAFNTKEARYVARAKQEEQIKQVKDWLANWNLTKATEGKRRPIFLPTLRRL